MHGPAVTLVLVSAILHATWNAQLKGGRSGDHDRPQFMSSMSLVMGLLALLSAPFVPLPASSAWVCVAVSAALHSAYNPLLLQNYTMSNFASTYPVARGISPLLVTLGAFCLCITLVLWATHYAALGIVSAFRETSVLWAIVIGRVFLGEAFTWRRSASACLICCGVILLVTMSR